MIRNIFIVLLLSVLGPSFSLSEATENNNSLVQKQKHLFGLQKKWIWIENQIKEAKKEYGEETVETLKKKLETKIEKLELEKTQAENQFFEMASGVNFSEETPLFPSGKRDFFQEFQELLAPMISSFRRLSERPRKIEKLKDDISLLTKKLIITERGLKDLEDLSKRLGNQFQSEFKLAHKKLKDWRDQIYFKKVNLERRLFEEQRNEKSLLSVAGSFIETFFKTKGTNVILAIMVFSLLFFPAFLVQNKIFDSPFFLKKFKTLHKPMNALYGTMTVVVSSIGSLACLYFLNDWLLVTLLLLIIMGLLWSSKQIIPQYIKEIRLYLNLGSVKEGERIIWKGVPWKVHKIGIYSTLINPSLQGGKITLPASTLISMNSRPIVSDEPWFPSKKGDWVGLNDGLFGKIDLQTPEQVIFSRLGVDKIFIPTSQYLDLAPTNFSQGFALTLSFGLDYEIQSKINSDILKIFNDEMKDKFHSYLYSGEMTGLEVTFDKADASSLNLWLKVNCKGSLAPKRESLIRQTQAFMVDVCNNNELSIPFTQVTIHQAEASPSLT